MSRKDRSFHFVSLVFAGALALSGCGGGDSDPGSSGGLGAAAPERIVKWMEDLTPALAHQKLNEIVIPGTHDSGTYNITASSAVANDGSPRPCDLPLVKTLMAVFDSIPVFTGTFPPCSQTQAGWSKTQTRSIRQQLDDGIRYIDLRVWHSAGQYQVAHSLVSVDIDTVLNDVKSFYAAQGWQSKEIVILDINHTYEMTVETDRILVQKIKSALTSDAGKSLLIPRCSNADCSDPTDLTLAKLWSNPDQRVIVFYDYASEQVMRDNRELWYNKNESEDRPASRILSPYFNTNSLSGLSMAMRKSAWDDTQHAGKKDRTVTEFQADGGFTVMQAIRTIDAKGVDIRDGLTTLLWNKYGVIKCIDDYSITVLGITVTVPTGMCVSDKSIWDDRDWCRWCEANLLGYGDQTNRENITSRWVDEIFAPTSTNIIIVDDYAAGTVAWKYRDRLAGYVDTVKQMNLARACDRWHVSYPVTGDFKYTKSANLAIGRIDGNARPELVALHIGDDGGDYRIGWNVNGKGHPKSWSDPIAIPGSWYGTTDGGIAIGDIDGNGRPELVVFWMPPGDFFHANEGRYRIGWNLNESGVATSWSADFKIAGGQWGSEVAGGAIAMGDLDGNGRPDLVVFNVERSDRYHATFYRIGWNIDAKGIAASWSAPVKKGDWSEGHVYGTGAAIGDVNGDGRSELIAFHVGAVAGGKKDGLYQVGVLDTAKSGSAVSWGAPIAMGGQWGQDPLGAGMAMGDLNGDGRPDLAVFQVERKQIGFDTITTGSYQFALDVGADGVVAPSRCAP